MPGLNGLVVMVPTSISSTGSGNSSSIGAQGKVTFSSCSTLQLNGVFTTAFDNYMLVVRSSSTTSNDSLYLRFAASGTVTTDSNYTYQYVSGLATSVNGGKFTSQSAARIGNTDNEQRGGDVTYIFGPRLTQPTALRNVHVYGEGGAGIVDFACRHSTSAAYDGIWLQSGAGLITGAITVYGFNQ